MKIFSAQQVHAWDAATIDEQQITGSMLMERACVAFTQTFLQVLRPDAPILIVCGTGNNGGDGFVVARLALVAGLQVQLLQLGDAARIRGDAAQARADFLAAGGQVAAFGQAKLEETRPTRSRMSSREVAISSMPRPRKNGRPSAIVVPRVYWSLE